MKAILIITAVFCIVLLAGCAAPKTKVIQPTLSTPATDGVEDQAQTAEPESSATTTDSNSNAGISKEDLDKLKADLEGMEFDDLEGLSD